jgi:ribonucleotide reductase alpha subunit
VAEQISFEGFITKLRKQLRDSYQQIGDTMVAGGVKDMDQYKYLLGQAHALQYIDQEISNLLNPKEKKDEQTDDSNIIQFGRDSED